jgi:hypothetical protein
MMTDGKRRDVQTNIVVTVRGYADVLAASRLIAGWDLQ